MHVRLPPVNIYFSGQSRHNAMPSRVKADTARQIHSAKCPSTTAMYNCNVNSCFGMVCSTIKVHGERVAMPRSKRISETAWVCSMRVVPGTIRAKEAIKHYTSMISPYKNCPVRILVSQLRQAHAEGSRTQPSLGRVGKRGSPGEARN